MDEVVAIVGPTKDVIFGQPSSLYERLGGKPAVEAAVGVFYERIMSDKGLIPFFKGGGHGQAEAAPGGQGPGAVSTHGWLVGWSYYLSHAKLICSNNNT